MTDKERNEKNRADAVRYILAKPIEQRHLIIFQRDFDSYLQSQDWLKTQEARNFQKYYDFLECFRSLQGYMKEFSWSIPFLKENGIDFKEIRKLYFAVS